MTTWYAIRHTPTGGFLPSYGSRKGRGGFTHDEPSTTEPPRLFAKRSHAATALTYWLKGVHVPAPRLSDPETGEMEHYVTAEPPPTPRRAEDMEVVTVLLDVVTP